MNETDQSAASKIQSHPTAAFFFFAFLISWTSWYAAPLIGGTDLSVVSLVNVIAGFGPAFSALFVSAVLNSDPSGADLKKEKSLLQQPSHPLLFFLPLHRRL